MKFIIDADIIRSAGHSEHPISSTSRNLLDEVIKHKSETVYCKTLMAEWRKHRSTYSTKWIAAMISKKKLVLIPVKTEAKDFLESLEESTDKKVALKDAHLVDLAIASNKIIFSNDANAKNAFSKLLDKRSNFKKIYWLSPRKDMNIILNYALKNKIINDNNLEI
jgi:predicted nucleic acid-binding protein